MLLDRIHSLFDYFASFRFTLQSLLLSIIEVRQFIGEEVQIIKYVDPNTKGWPKHLGGKLKWKFHSSLGPDVLLQQMSKKPKLNILDNSRKGLGFKRLKFGAWALLKKSVGQNLDKVASLQLMI